MDPVAKLRELLRKDMDARVPVQTVWATCTSVNSEEGTMEATREGLEYYDVLLGLGGDRLEPIAGSKVLLGLVENKAAACFLIYAEETERRNINGDAFGGLARADAIAQELASLQQDLNALKGVFQAWVTVPNDGGAALKAGAATWAGNQLQVTTQQDIQNPKVNHG